MPIHNISENIIFVVLPAEPQLGDELKSVNEMLSNKCDSDVILDFSRVEVVTSPNIANLLILRDWVRWCKNKVILCNVALPTKCMFTKLGLDTVFDYADDQFTALESIERAKSQRP